MSYELTGKIKLIQPAKRFDSGFIKREFVVTVDGKYPQDIKLEKTSGTKADKDYTAILDKFSEGDVVKVQFELKGNEWKGNYYVSLTAMRIDKLDGEEAVDPESADTSVKNVPDEEMPF